LVARLEVARIQYPLNIPGLDREQVHALAIILAERILSGARAEFLRERLLAILVDIDDDEVSRIKIRGSEPAHDRRAHLTAANKNDRWCGVHLLLSCDPLIQSE
jgi:hypothetical protein